MVANFQRILRPAPSGLFFVWTIGITKLAIRGVTVSPDNAACEGIFGRLKAELFILAIGSQRA
ncbi:hypothetical protein PSYPI_29099 [Pseudomonas syringae pv. pisi str. 1704B]|uniref:Uncharacterized protein n=1 Tax=Pseudomonas syringae pv. pisi str. 1704B TaxID=629263 RepID=F3GGE8_PSESJ|nr:hypothetical protein PSYPI_29099 [Pseudomonas syringae pv. pisi str. 1704B]